MSLNCSALHHMRIHRKPGTIKHRLPEASVSPELLRTAIRIAEKVTREELVLFWLEDAATHSVRSFNQWLQDIGAFSKQELIDIMAELGADSLREFIRRFENRMKRSAP